MILVLFAKRLFVLFALALVMAQASAYQLTVNVTVADNTAAVGTNVTLVQGGTALYSTRADGYGLAHFVVPPGDYFVLLSRLSYPQYVSLVSVNADTFISRTMSQGFSPYASAYGQVSGPSTFTGAQVTAYSNGQIIKRTTPSADGSYMLSYTLPEGDYQLVFGADGFDNKTVDVHLSQGAFTEVDATLSKTVAAQNATPPSMLSSPPQIQQHSAIEVSLSQPGAVSGQAILVQTPSGAITIMTNSQGIAYINAAEGGTYTFTYGALSSSTDVIPAVPPAHNTTPPAANTTPPAQQPPAQAPPQPQQPAGGSMPLALAILAGVVIGLIIFAALVYIFLKHGKHRGGHGEAGHHANEKEHEGGHHGHGGAGEGEAGHTHSHSHQHGEAGHEHTHQHAEAGHQHKGYHAKK